MTVEEMKRRKREAGYTFAQIAELSGVPLGTVQKIFSGETSSPRYDTVMALERLFAKRDDVREDVIAYGKNETERHTIVEYYQLPEEKRVELIDGAFYDMAAPSTLHQRIAGEVHRQIANYIIDHNGSCVPFISPVDIQLDCDEHTMIQPDVAIVCKREQIELRCVFGAPDFIMEVISPGTKKKDYLLKLNKYQNAGVREYWIIDPEQNVVLVYFFENPNAPIIYGIQGKIPVNIYNGELAIEMDRIVKWIDEERP